MKKPVIISEIKVNGQWVNQDDLSPEYVRTIVDQTIIKAAALIGFEAARSQTAKSA